MVKGVENYLFLPYLWIIAIQLTASTAYTFRASSIGMNKLSMSVASSPTSNDTAPFYITIGPQCAGKTTYISNSLPSNTKDVTIDDQEGVYYDCPIDFFLHPKQELNKNKTEKGIKKDNDKSTVIESSHEGKNSRNEVEGPPAMKELYNKTLIERVSCPTQMEMKIVLEHFTQQHRKVGHINDNQTAASKSLEIKFKETAKKYSKTNIPSWKLEYNHELLQDLIQAMQENSSSGLQFHEPNDKVDLFLQEALFQPPASAIEKAQSLLSSSSISSPSLPIAWGNTNTKLRDFEGALQLAQKMGRPVHFIVFDAFGNSNSSTSSHGTINDRNHHQKRRTPTKTFQTMEWELPYQSRKDLIKRNIKRLCETGRYVNVKAIDSAIQSCQTMLLAAQDEMMMANDASSYGKDHNNPSHTRLDFDKALAKLAGYQMSNDRKVIQIGPPKNLSSRPNRNMNPNHHSNNRGRGRGRERHNSQSRNQQRDSSYHPYNQPRRDRHGPGNPNDRNSHRYRRKEHNP